MRANHWTAKEKTEIVLAVLSREHTLEEAAGLSGVEKDVVREWIDLYLVGAKQGVRSGRASPVSAIGSALRRRSVRVAGGAMLAVLMLFLSAEVLSSDANGDGCADELICFYPNTPAVANDLNDNLNNIVTWMEQKVGAVGTENVTVTGQLDIGASGETRISTDGKLMMDQKHGNHDVWIQGKNATSGGDDRNLAMLGLDEDSGDTLHLNWQGEYDGGVVIGSSATVEGDLTVRRPDEEIAAVMARGSSQGMGMVYVGQSSVNGGGMAYNGTGDTAMVGEEDRVTFFRKYNDVSTEVFSYSVYGGIRVGSNGSSLGRIMTGIIGDCTTAGSSSSGSVSFDPAFSVVPLVFLQVSEEYNESGCTSVRLTERTTTGFKWASYNLANAMECDCIHWMAIGTD